MAVANAIAPAVAAAVAAAVVVAGIPGALAVGSGMSSGRTRPWMTWSAPSRAMVAMQPAIRKSSRRQVARASIPPSISSRRISMPSASSTCSPVHASSSSPASSALAALQPLDLGLLPGRPRRGLRFDAAVARGGGPVGLGHRHRPLPAGRQLVGEALKLCGRELLEEDGILEPCAGFVVPGEQVAQYRAAGGLVDMGADEPGDRGGRRDPFLGQQPFDLPGGGPVALFRDLFPDRPLAGMVGGDREGLEGFQVDPVGAVGVEQVRGGVAETEALLDQALRQAEARRDGGDAHAGVGQSGEGGDLVGRMHRAVADILGERDLAGDRTAGLEQAGHGPARIENALFGERVEHRQAASAGDHGEAFVALGIGIVGADDQVLEQAMGPDRGLQPSQVGGIGRRLAHILGRQGKPVQRDRADDRLGRGCDMVHAGFPRCGQVDG